MNFIFALLEGTKEVRPVPLLLEIIPLLQACHVLPYHDTGKVPVQLEYKILKLANTKAFHGFRSFSFAMVPSAATKNQIFDQKILIKINMGLSLPVQGKEVCQCYR